MDAASVPVIVGPTAAGKSAVAMWLAAQGIPVTIVSADSRQVYRRFDVGTAKPTVAEQALVPHAGIDVVDPVVGYSAYAWSELATCAIEDARRAGRSPVVVGGTGLYVRTLFDVAFTEPLLDAARRDAVRSALAGLPTDELRRWCERLDPPRAALGRVQLLRSIEIALLTGHRLSTLHTTHGRTPRWRARYLVVDPGAALGERIATRARAMLDGPWPDEVRALLGSVPADAPAWRASGYAAVRELVEGTITYADALERIVVETRQYAKRQRTWFRHQLPADRVLRIDPEAPSWQQSVIDWWNGEGEGRDA